MNHCETSFRGYGGLPLYAQAWRPGTGPARAVVGIVHGAGEHSGRYGNLVDWLVPKGYALYGFDLRGHGRSPGPRGYVNRFAEFREDVFAFMAFARQQERRGQLFLLGHSLGGLIVLEAVLHDPSGLDGVVVSGPTLTDLPISAGKLLLARMLSAVWPRFTLATGLEVDALSRDRAVVEAYVRDPLVHDRGTARLGTEIMAAIAWTQAHAAEFSLPLFMVQGGADRLAYPKGSQTFFERVAFPDKERRVYEDTYHEVFNEVGKERVLADVEAWLEARL